MNTKSIRHEEYTYQGKRVVLDAALLAPGEYETMLLYRASGAEIASYSDATEGEALRHFEALRAAHLPDRERKAAQPLAGKYAKLRDDLRAALAIGLEAAAKVEDGGTCCFDAPALRLPRWSADMVERACKEAGGGCFDWNPFRSGKLFVVCLPVPGQAYKREVAAEAMTAVLSGMGYEAICYQQAD